MSKLHDQRRITWKRFTFDLPNFTNKLNSKTCFTENHKIFFSLILSNTQLFLSKNNRYENGLSDNSKLVSFLNQTPPDGKRNL